ncbi:SGNH/GDSL hydrolase family protein [Microbacterium sp.]|uniref:SGNH/GDSL hydrolase family protein n=1 Tax=Microbacterium sp. TaxID=51671 RepID=UPI0028116F7A|nr:SGNH/GDSL hydrolase family protein [Microbacterium sp.]
MTVIAAMLLAGTATLGAVPAAAETPPGAPYVALGDSQAAGTGNLPYVDDSCLRSKKAYPLLLSAASGIPVASSACAGASTQDVLTGQLGDLGPGTQLVTVTVGANDFDWRAIFAACSSVGSDAACAAAVNAAQATVAALPLRIAQIIGTVRTLAPNAQIMVTGYPLIFGTVSGTCSIGAVQGEQVRFSAAQALAVNNGVTGLNMAVQFGVAAYVGQTGDPGVEYVDIAAGFAGHGLCDTGDRWISGLVSGGPVQQRGFHPNAAGQQAYADTIAAALSQ